MAKSEGFHTTTLPMRAGAQGRLPAIAVKLKGVMAYTKPSRGRYSRRLLEISAHVKDWRVRPAINSLPDAWRVMDGLLGVEFFGIFDIESVCTFSRRAFTWQPQAVLPEEVA